MALCLKSNCWNFFKEFLKIFNCFQSDIEARMRHVAVYRLNIIILVTEPLDMLTNLYLLLKS